MDYIKKRSWATGSKFAIFGGILCCIGLVLAVNFLWTHNLDNAFFRDEIIGNGEILINDAEGLAQEHLYYIQVQEGALELAHKANEPVEDGIKYTDGIVYTLASGGKRMIFIMPAGDMLVEEQLPFSQLKGKMITAPEGLWEAVQREYPGEELLWYMMDCYLSHRRYDYISVAFMAALLLAGAGIMIAGLVFSKKMLVSAITKPFESEQAKKKALLVLQEEMAQEPAFSYKNMCVTKNFVVVEKFFGTKVFPISRISWFYKVNPEVFIKGNVEKNKYVLVMLTHLKELVLSPDMEEKLADECLSFIRAQYPWIVTEKDKGPAEYDKVVIESFVNFVAKRKEQYKAGEEMDDFTRYEEVENPVEEDEFI